MVKQLSIAAIVIIIIFILTGVIEVSVHTERLSNVPEKLISLSTNQALISSARAWTVNIKREAEQKFIQDSDQKLTLALNYVKIDSDRLDTLVSEAKTDPDQIVPQATLLLQSIKRVSALLENASANQLADVKSEAGQSIITANQSFRKLTFLRDQPARFSDELVVIADSLKEYIGNVDLAADNQPDVAGTQDKNQSNIQPSPTSESSPIPLEF
ncbi:MAG: hypothetical protein U1C49_02610 [Candidatus Andersenbacteria bacterium]|nr:hypothetical protein [bacterium]MDZ4225719.1 hypothetical protein [Candidatus Andersenbacteria bacterium]